MHRYGKGARSERELIQIFSQGGFSVIRAAGSGVNSLSPDILVFRRGRQYALECKAWNNGRVAIEPDKYEALRRWEDNTGITTMIAWKMPYEGWYFIYLNELEKNERSYSITKRRAREINRKLDAIKG
jgi:Holliday junction resolvase